MPPTVDDPYQPSETLPGETPPTQPPAPEAPLPPVEPPQQQQQVAEVPAGPAPEQPEQPPAAGTEPGQTYGYGGGPFMPGQPSPGLPGGATARQPRSLEGIWQGSERTMDLLDYVRPGDRPLFEAWRRRERNPRGGVIDGAQPPAAPGTQPPSQETMSPPVPEPEQAVNDFQQSLDPNAPANDPSNIGWTRSLINATTEQFVRQAGADLPRGLQIITGASNESGLGQTANRIDQFLHDNLQINPAYRDDWMVNYIGPGVGAIGGFFASIFLGGAATKAIQGAEWAGRGVTAAARLLGIGGDAASALPGAAGAVTTIEDAAAVAPALWERTAGFLFGRNAVQAGGRAALVANTYAGSGAQQYRDALQSGASFDDMISAGRWNGALSVPLEVLPVLAAFERADRVSGGAIQRILTRAIGNTGYQILADGISEAGTEAIQQIASNLVASDIVRYDPQRDMFDEVGGNAIGGFSGGAFMALVLSLLPGGHRVHQPGGRDFPPGGLNGEVFPPGEGPPGPPNSPGPAPLNRQLPDQSTRYDFGMPRSGIEGHEQDYFALPPREDRNEFLRGQQQRIRDIDAAWKKDNPEYVGDPSVGASLDFYNYLLRSEADFDRLRNLPPEHASRPDVQARLQEVQANREIIDMLMDPIRMVNRPTWILQRPGKGRMPGSYTLLATENGQPISRTGSKTRVVGADGKDYFVGSGQVIQIDNVSPENIIMSPQGQHLLRMARLRQEAEARAAEDQMRASQQAEMDATSGATRTDPRRAMEAQQAAIAGPAQRLGLPAPPMGGTPGQTALPAPQGVQHGPGFTMREDTAPASPEATAQALAQATPPGPQGELFHPTVTNSTRPDTMPSGIKPEPLSPPSLTQQEQLEFNGLTQTSGEQAAAQQRAGDTGAAAMATIIPQRVALEDLPGTMRAELDKAAIRRGVKLPETFSKADLMEAGFPEAEAEVLFRKISDTQREAEGQKAAEQSRTREPPKRGIAGIMEFFKDLPSRERRALRSMLRHFERHIGANLSSLDIIDFANWAAAYAAKTGKENFADNPANAAAFLNERMRAMADNIRRAAIALRSETAGSPAAAKAVRTVAHELTHFLIGLSGQNAQDMEQLWFKVVRETPNDPIVRNILREYSDITNMAVLGEEYLAHKVEAALAGRYETSFEQMGPDEDPSLRTYVKEFIRRIYQFVADVLDRVLGRDIISQVFAGTAQQFGVKMDTFSLDSVDLNDPYSDTGWTSVTDDEKFAKRASEDANVPQVVAAVAEYYAVRFKGENALQRFNSYMTKEFGSTWTDRPSNERRQFWENAVRKTEGHDIDNAYRYGVLSGAPKNMTKLTELLGMARRGEGPDGKGRFWYQLSEQEIKERFGVYANQFMMYLAVTSPTQGVPGNVTQAVSGMAQANMRPQVPIGEYPELGIKKLGVNTVTAMANAVKAHGQWSESATKTQAFYRALSDNLDMSEDDTAVIDRWMMRALGFDTDNPTPQQYAHARLILQTLADALGWRVKEVQAAIWVAIKMEDARKASQNVSNYADNLQSQEATLNFEIAPSQNLAVGRIMAGLTYDQRKKITDRAVAETMQATAQILGVHVFNPQWDVVHGGYLMTVNPSVVSSIPLPDWAADATAAALGYVMRQDSVLVTRINPPASKLRNPTGYSVVTFEGIDSIDKDLAESFWKHAVAKNKRLKGGYAIQGKNLIFWNIGGESETHLRRVRWSGLSDKEFVAALADAATTFDHPGTIAVSTPGKGEARLIGNDWSTSQHGEDYRQVLERVRPGVTNQLDAVRASVDQILSQEFTALGTSLPREGDQNTVGRIVTPSVPLAGSVDVYDGEDREQLAGIEPGAFAQNEIYSRFGQLQQGVDTTSLLKIYDLSPLLTDDAKLNQWLQQFGANVKYFSFESIPEAGVEEVIPRVAVDGYNKGTLWIYDPRVAAGSFKDAAYTRAWRITHELAHGIVEPLLQAKYGASRRYGRLGQKTTMMRGKGDKKVEVEQRALTLAEAQRAVEWEDAAFRAQRLLLADLGVQISDEQFAQEYNTNLADAMYRITTSQFGDPGEYGFVPASQVQDLYEALRSLERIEFQIAEQQGRDPTKGAPLETEWDPISDDEIVELVNKAKVQGLSAVAANPKDDYPGEFFEHDKPGSAAELTSPLAYTKLAAAIRSTPLKEGTVGEWRAYLREQQVPLDEMRWSGMIELLEQGGQGKISRHQIQTYMAAAEMVIEGDTAGELTLRSGPFDPQRTVTKIAYVPRNDELGRTVLTIQGIQTNQPELRTALAIRRAIHWAVENGFNGIAWMAPSELNRRVKEHKRLRWEQPLPDGTVIYKTTLPDGATFSGKLEKDGTATLGLIDLKPTLRGAGLGRKLVQEFERSVADHGGREITGDALPSAVSFWRRMGYSVKEEPDENGYHTMTKEITPELGEVGPLYTVDKVGHQLAKQFASPVESTSVKVSTGDTTPGGESKTRNVPAVVLPVNAAMDDSVNEETNGIYFRRAAANPPPGYQPGPTNRWNFLKYFSRMIDWYKATDRLFTQSSKIIRNLGRTKSAYELGNHFRRDPWMKVAPGTDGIINEDYHSVLNGIWGQFMPKLSAKLSGMTKEAIAEVPDALRSGKINSASGLSVADARWFRAFFDEVLSFTNDHMRGQTRWGKGAGSPLVTRDDLVKRLNFYFPQVWTLEHAFEKGHAFAGMSKTAAAHEYFKRLAFFQGDPQQDTKINDLINTLMGESSFVSYAASRVPLAGSVTQLTNHTRDRLLNIDPNVTVTLTINGKTAQIKLADFLSNDTAEVMTRYVIGMARHAEFVRRFGPKGEEITRLMEAINRERTAAGMEPLHGEKANQMMYQVQANLHMIQNRPSKASVRRQEWIKFATNANLLFFTTFASLPEAMMAGVRMGFKGQFNALAAGLEQIFSTVTRQGETETRKIAKDLGVIRDHLQSSLLDLATSYGNFTPTKWNDYLYKGIALHGWTNLGITMNTAAAIRALPDWAEKAAAGSEKHARWLREVGLTHQDVQGMDPDSFVVGQNHKIDAAIRQIVGETIIESRPGMLPGWHSDARFKLVSHLKSFMTGFGNTVMQRPIREGMHGNFMPMIWLAGYAALAGLLAKEWEWLWWGATGNPSWHRAGLQDRPLMQYILSSISRGGLAGPFQFIFDAISMNRTAQGGSAVGQMIPSASMADRVWNLITSGAQVVAAAGDNPTAFRNFVSSATQLVPLLSSAGGYREALVDRIAPRTRNGVPIAPPGTGPARGGGNTDRTWGGSPRRGTGWETMPRGGY